MNWRKWLVRGLVFSVLGGGVLGFVLYYSWTNPATIRRQVLAKLMERFPGASVSLDSARLRLFGGIQVGEMRLSRRDDLDKAAFLYVPSAVIYHDKEQLLDGVLAILKLELHEPRLRVVRDHEGRINLVGVAAPPPLDLHEALPTIIIQHGTLDYEDQSTGCGVRPPDQGRTTHGGQRSLADCHHRRHRTDGRAWSGPYPCTNPSRFGRGQAGSAPRCNFDRGTTRGTARPALPGCRLPDRIIASSSRVSRGHVVEPESQSGAELRCDGEAAQRCHDSSALAAAAGRD